MNQQHDIQTTDVTATPAVLPQEQAPGLSRRKFLTRAGVGSLPVIMSIKSGSAWGCVDLKCTPGETSLSNSGSAVASATSSTDGKPAAYTKPNWSSISQIQYVFSQDFNSYLLQSYKKNLYVRDTSKRKTTYNLIQKDPCDAWWNTVKTSTCYTSKSTSSVYSNSLKRQPAMYSGKLLVNSTKFSDIFGAGSSDTLITCLTRGDTLEKYLVAAFIGAVWERHPEYLKQYGSRDLCYPTPNELVTAYQNALVRVDAYGRAGTYDLHSLLKFYTIGA